MCHRGIFFHHHRQKNLKWRCEMLCVKIWNKQTTLNDKIKPRTQRPPVVVYITQQSCNVDTEQCRKIEFMKKFNYSVQSDTMKNIITEIMIKFLFLVLASKSKCENLNSDNYFSEVTFILIKYNKNSTEVFNSNMITCTQLQFNK